MKLKIIQLLYIASFFFLYSCFEKEKALPGVPGYLIGQSMYENQIYLSFSQDSIMQVTKNSSWNLGFEASDDGWHIILNSSNFMMAANTKLTDFNAVTSEKNLKFTFDASMGSLDSTAIGEWGKDFLSENPLYTGYVYVIDLGTTNNGEKLGFKKVIFEKLENGEYFFKYANLDGSNLVETSVKKMKGVNFVHYAFDKTFDETSQEPQNTNWDIVFQTYTTLLYENGTIPTPYSVRGVLLNRNGTMACMVDTTNNFFDINFNTVLKYKFSDKQDIIGYDWKQFKNSTYILNSKFTYIIKTQNKEYYKMRFSSFLGGANSKLVINYQKIQKNDMGN